MYLHGKLEYRGWEWKLEPNLVELNIRIQLGTLPMNPFY